MTSRTLRMRESPPEAEIPFAMLSQIESDVHHAGR